MEKSFLKSADNNYFETIIIGGGMAGIGCARTLAKQNKDFLLISKDIGGRVTSSPDGNTNYGAFYIRDDYTHILPFVRLTKRITVSSLRFQRGIHSWTFWDVLSKYPLTIAKLYLHLFYFNYHYQQFKKNCEQFSQRDALQMDTYLKKLHSMRATDFLEKHNLSALIPLLIDPVVKSTAFLDVEEMPLSAGEMILLLLIGIHSTHEFVLKQDRLTAGIEKNTRTDEVVEITKENTYWRVKTSSGDEYTAAHVVMATPIHISKKLLNQKLNTNQPISVHMVHLRGTLLPAYQAAGDLILFASHTTADIVISKGSDNTFLFYSHNPRYDLSVYFNVHEIIAEKFWHPAFFIGHEFIPCCFDDNLYIIGDHNVVGMEDTFITGIYAANQIIKDTK